MMKRARVIGSTLRVRPNSEKAAVMAELERQVWPRIESGDIRPIVDSTFPIEQAEEAHALVASDRTIGKVVMTVTN